MIAHITTRDAWLQAQPGGQYRHTSLETQGFVHCSTPTEEQLIAVANAVFRGQPDLVLLLVDPRHLTAELRYEEFEDSGKFFPHVYGPINVMAVTQVLDFPPQADGSFRLPDLLV